MIDCRQKGNDCVQSAQDEWVIVLVCLQKHIGHHNEQQKQSALSTHTTAAVLYRCSHLSTLVMVGHHHVLAVTQLKDTE